MGCATGMELSARIINAPTNAATSAKKSPITRNMLYVSVALDFIGFAPCYRLLVSKLKMRRQACSYILDCNTPYRRSGVAASWLAATGHYILY